MARYYSKRLTELGMNSRQCRKCGATISARWSRDLTEAEEAAIRTREMRAIMNRVPLERSGPFSEFWSWLGDVFKVEYFWMTKDFWDLVYIVAVFGFFLVVLPCILYFRLLDQGTSNKRTILRVIVSSRVVDSAAADPRNLDPRAVKRHLGLDAARSWVVLSESNLFDWPGPDLRPVGDRDDGSVAYGFLPPRYFAELRRRFSVLEAATRSRRVRRTE